MYRQHKVGQEGMKLQSLKKKKNNFSNRQENKLIFFYLKLIQIIFSIRFSWWENKIVINKTPKSHYHEFILWLFHQLGLWRWDLFGKRLLD